MPRHSKFKQLPARAAEDPSSNLARVGPYTVQPLGARILVRIVPPDDTTPGGLFIPQTARASLERLTGHVVAVGPNVSLVQVGDRVLLSSMARYDFRNEDGSVVILDAEHVAAVLS